MIKQPKKSKSAGEARIQLNVVAEVPAPETSSRASLKIRTGVRVGSKRKRIACF